MPIKFNIPCSITKRGTPDLYGQVGDGITVLEKCQVVKLETRLQNSTVRTDSSASRGRAIEDRGDAVILVSRRSVAMEDDKLTVAGVALRIMAVRPRFAVTGELDHYQLTCELA